MPRDKQENHFLIKKAMQEEFLTNGYANSSMRNIANRCGLSASALYRHYKNKDDMFHDLVYPLVQKINIWSKHHADTKYDLMENGKISKQSLFDESLIDLVENVIYPQKEMYCLLFFRSQGSEYENYLDQLIESQVHEMMHVFDVLKDAGIHVDKPLKEELHMLISAYMYAILHPVIHLYTKDQMKHCLQTTKDFFLPGWMNLMGL